MIFFVALLVWFIFNGKWSVEILLLGLLFSAAVYYFYRRFVLKKDADPASAAQNLRRFPYYVDYLFTLIWEILKANAIVIKITLSPRMHIEPQIVSFRTDIKSEALRVMLANSITLTPGTITVSLDGDVYRVHCLDKSLGEGIDECVFVKKLRRIEAI